MSDSLFIIIIIIILYLFSNHYNHPIFEKLSSSNDIIFIFLCINIYLLTNNTYKYFGVSLLLFGLILFKRSDKDVIFKYLGVEKSIFLPTFIKNFILKFKSLDANKNNEPDYYQQNEGDNMYENDNENEDEISNLDDEISLISDEEENNRNNNLANDEISELSNNLEGSMDEMYEKLNKKIEKIEETEKSQ
jgi:hypothetical protein